MHLRTLHGDLNLIIGKAFHAFAARYYSEGQFGFPSEEALNAYGESIKMFNDAVEELPEKPSHEHIEKAKRILEKLCYSYPGLSAKKDDNLELTPKAVETKFAIKITNNTAIVGQIDLFATTKFGAIIMDHKTAGSARSAYFWNYELDPQAIIYPWASAQLGWVTSRFMVNVITKTKEPYIARETVIVDEETINKHMDWLIKDVEEKIDPLPDDFDEIMKLDRVFLNCRRCQFKDLCYTNSDYSKVLLKKNYTQTNHFQNELQNLEEKK